MDERHAGSCRPVLTRHDPALAAPAARRPQTPRPMRAYGLPLLMLAAIMLCFMPHAVAGPLSMPQLFPVNNIWNTPIDSLTVDALSTAWINSIGAASRLHPDFGAPWGIPPEPIGIPYVLVPGDQPKVPVSFWYADESDPGPYPIPSNPPIEAGGDAHMLLIDADNRILYELYAAHQNPDGSWEAGSGAIFDLQSNALRPDGWTSADAAGLPIFPGLVRYDEVMSGSIDHAIRFTAPRTRREYIWPARHYASSLTSDIYPPMGARFRLKADFDTVHYFNPETGTIEEYSFEDQVILTALKKYGMILADNGSPWYITGAPDDRWDNEQLHALTYGVHGYDFEAVDASPLMVDPNSAEVTPEPGSLLLLGSGLAAFAVRRRFTKESGSIRNPQSRS